MVTKLNDSWIYVIPDGLHYGVRGRVVEAVNQEEDAWLLWRLFWEKGGEFVPISQDELDSLPGQHPEIDGEDFYTVDLSGSIREAGIEICKLEDLSETELSYDSDTGTIWPLKQDPKETETPDALEEILLMVSNKLLPSDLLIRHIPTGFVIHTLPDRSFTLSLGKETHHLEKRSS